MSNSSAETTPIPQIDEPSFEATRATSKAKDDSESGIPVLKVVLFLAGTILLIVAAANLTNLSGWSDRWGAIPVFLVFFLVMSIAGRWFWTGADAIVSAIVGNKR
ncbi:hypothetical protein [Gordonia sp. CPCC 205333]|uniref:hypothetical protein n=1 Tax=Gordonia sp. CPCC 205333 TaxID=3140790 RepID=UPI003AF36B28